MKTKKRKNTAIIMLIIMLAVIVTSCLPPPTFDEPEDEIVLDPKGSSAVSFSVLEAENFIVQSVFLVGNHEMASSGEYLFQPSTIQNSASATISAQKEVNLIKNNYTIWVRMYGISSNQDAAYLGVDNYLRRVYPKNYETYEWVNAGIWTLSGIHNIILGHGESDTRIDLIIISNETLSLSELNSYVNATVAETPNNTIPDNSTNDTRSLFSLKGDVNFDASKLSTNGRIWHTRLINGLVSQDPLYVSRAESDHLYNYGRDLHTFIQSLLWGLRATGDLRLLDEVDRFGQIIRGKLDDSWCADSPDPHYGYTSPDGFLNWRYRGSSTIHYCRDVIRLDESKTHGMIATIAYAYEVNRNVKSPKGIDYAERADFWKDYLFNHYEKKWQGRMKRDDALAYVEGYNSGHPQLSNIKMHYYMYKLSGNEKYLLRANGMSEQVFAGLRIASTSNGDAYVWASKWRTDASSGSTFFLHQSTYARYVFADFAELHIENVGEWGKPIHVQRFANTLTQFMMDDGSNSLARDIGGGVERAGIPPTSESGDRITVSRFAMSPFVMIIPWDDSGKGAAVSEGFFDKREGSSKENPRFLHIPAGMLFYYEWNR